MSTTPGGSSSSSSVFVYHANDGEGALMAALVKECDADRQFEFLAVSESATVARMERFLLSQGFPQPERVRTPFVVLVRPGDPPVRSVLIGEPLDAWFRDLVESAVPAGGELRGVVQKHLSPFTLRLVLAAFSDAAAPAGAPAGAAAPAGAGAAAGAAPIDGGATDIDEAEAEQGYAMASRPTPQKRTGAVSISEAMAQSKARDAMSQRKTW